MSDVVNIINDILTKEVIQLDEFKEFLEAIRDFTVVVDSKLIDFEQRLVVLEDLVLPEEEE